MLNRALNLLLYLLHAVNILIVYLVDNEMMGNALLLGHSISGLVLNEWKNAGQNQALKLINEVNKNERQVKIRWV